jgi:hypothetical protein
VTEAEWLNCADTQSLWESPYLWQTGRVSERKYRLFAVACARRIWTRLNIGPCRRAVEVSERYADGLATDDELAAVGAEVEAFGEQGTLSEDDRWLLGIAASHVWDRSLRLAGQVSGDCVHVLGQHPEGAEELAQCAIIRDMFPNPSRPASVDSAWLTSDALALARGMYESRDFTALPVLADALEEAGCEEAELLAHCRGPGSHVRGCWLVDLVLGKS